MRPNRSNEKDDWFELQRTKKHRTMISGGSIRVTFSANARVHSLCFMNCCEDRKKVRLKSTQQLQEQQRTKVTCRCSKIQKSIIANEFGKTFLVEELRCSVKDKDLSSTSSNCREILHPRASSISVTSDASVPIKSNRSTKQMHDAFFCFYEG